MALDIWLLFTQMPGTPSRASPMFRHGKKHEIAYLYPWTSSPESAESLVRISNPSLSIYICLWKRKDEREDERREQESRAT